MDIDAVAWSVATFSCLVAGAMYATMTIQQKMMDKIEEQRRKDEAKRKKVMDQWYNLVGYQDERTNTGD